MSQVRPICRWYAGMVAVFQVALIALFIAQDVRFSLLMAAVFGLTLVGAVLIACDRPVGRSVFIPAALIQVFVAGLFAQVSWIGIIVGWFQQSESVATLAAIYTVISAGSVLYLGAGIILFMTALLPSKSNANT